MNYSRLILSVAVMALPACERERASGAAVEVLAPTAQFTAIAAEPAVPAVDPDSGLVIDEHWQLVKGHCGACHSLQLVTQNRGDRRAWLDMIRWMQATQGLWSLDPETETAILDYLSGNYAPQAGYRRKPLPPAQLPPNPFPGGEG